MFQFSHVTVTLWTVQINSMKMAGENKLIIMLGSLQMEKALLNTIGHLLKVSGWRSRLKQR